MDKQDVYDMLTDPDLASRTTFIKRQFALKLAAQVVYNAWYSYEDPAALAEVLRQKKFDPSKLMTNKLLEYSGSIDAKTLDVVRDVGVGAPQAGIVGIGAPTPAPAKESKPRSGLSE
jgi:hypothetical protein